MKKKEAIKLSKAQIKNILWERGEINWLLRPEQKEIYNELRNAKGGKFTFYASRRFGKSFICILMAIEDCLRNRNWEIGFVAPTKVQVRRVYGPIMEFIFRTCPKKLRPQWKAEVGGYLFPSTGSYLFMSGTDNQHWEDLLGMNLHKGYFDEPGTMSDLAQIVNRVVFPMTMTTKEERGDACGVILLGTPSATPAHDYYFIKEECKALGNYACRTIYDNSGLSEETIKQYIEESGGLESTNTKREYLCQDVVDTELAVVPEFTLEKEKEIVKEFERPEYYELYGALDPGFRNYSAYVLGYYDFRAGVVRIEGDLLINKKNTADIAKAIKEIENRLFPNKKVAIRYSDTEPQVICDLSRLHDLFFAATRKDGKEAKLNEVRTMIQNNRIIIHPRCKNLILHLKTAIWNEARTRYIETSDGGHFDLVDALIYLIRNLDVWTNPYPGKYDNMFPVDRHINEEAKRTDDVLVTALNLGG